MTLGRSLLVVRMPPKAAPTRRLSIPQSAAAPKSERRALPESTNSSRWQRYNGRTALRLEVRHAIYPKIARPEDPTLESPASNRS